MKKKSVRASAERWVTPFFKQYRTTLTFALLLGILTFICASALMFTSGYLISKAAEAPGNIMVIFLPVALVRIFGIGKPILHYFERLTSHDWILRMTSKLRLKLYTILEKDAIFFKQRFKTGDILGLLAEDLGHLQNLYLRSIFPTIVAWVLYVLLVLFLGYFSWWFALVMLLLLGVVVFLVPLVSLLVNGARQTRQKAIKNELYEDLTDNVLGVSDWVIAQRGIDYVASYKKPVHNLRSLNLQINKSSRRRDLLLQFIYAIIVVLILAWTGTQFGGTYAGTANWIAAFVLGFFPLIDAFSPLSEAAIEMNTYRDSIDRLNDLPEQDCGVSDAATPALTTPFILETQSLHFAYDQTDREVLHGLTLSVLPGEKLAILGRSGSGKSTLAALMRGDLMPTAGSVTLNGIPTNRFADDITGYIGVIQQQTYLFNATLADNLKVGKQDAADEELWAVLEQVELTEMVKRLPDGLQTMVDEAGLRFSGGERHRIALARVLLQQVPIVILDEPTVGLDPITEQSLLKTIFEAMADKTVIMITHHLQGVSLMDRVLFIENGAVTIDGTPAELEESNPRYQSLLIFDQG